MTPNPCIAGQSATVCAQVCNCGMSVTSGTINGTPVHVTPLDAGNVLVTISSGVLQTGSNALTLTSPSGSSTGTITGTGLPPTIAAVVAFFSTEADQIQQLTLKRMDLPFSIGLQDIETSGRVREAAHAKDTAVHGMDGARHVGLQMLADANNAVMQFLNSIQNPNNAQAVQQARRQINTKSGSVSHAITGERNLDEHVVTVWFDNAPPKIKTPQGAKDAVTKDLLAASDKVPPGEDHDQTLVNLGAAAGNAFHVLDPDHFQWNVDQLQAIVGQTAGVMQSYVDGCPCTWAIGFSNATPFDDTAPLFAMGDVPKSKGTTSINIQIVCVPDANGKPITLNPVIAKVAPSPPDAPKDWLNLGNFNNAQQGAQPGQYSGALTVDFNNPNNGHDATAGTLVQFTFSFDYNGHHCEDSLLLYISND